jgi:hypothetical protein
MFNDLLQSIISCCLTAVLSPHHEQARLRDTPSIAARRSNRRDRSAPLPGFFALGVPPSEEAYGIRNVLSNFTTKIGFGFARDVGLPSKLLGISHDKAGFPRANKRVSENEYINRAVGLNLLHLHPPHFPFYPR